MSQKSDQENIKSKTIFVGPAQNSWYKYRLGQIAVKYTTKYSILRKIPLGNSVFNWGIKNTIGARNTETIDKNK